MEQVKWKVSGMDCASCSAAITKSLQKQGMSNIKVNHISGDVSFETVELNGAVDTAAKNVEGLGYKVGLEQTTERHADHGHNHSHDEAQVMNKHLLRFLICLPFTLVLISHMWLPFHWLHNGYVQLALTLPVFAVGLNYFGVSAWKNLVKGIFHMNVLIAIGAIAAFAYSLVGLLTNRPEFLFFETAAAIITIVFFGNWLEHVSIEKTQQQIKELTRKHKVMANMIAYDQEHNEHLFPIENSDLKVGDLVLIKTGEEVPMDCKILTGDVEVNEAIITGESLPVHKKQGDILIGGSVLASGNAKCYISAVGKETVMNGIVQLMQDAQMHKPPVQQLADKISGIFVPAVLIIASLTLVLNIVIGSHTFGESLMRAIAVLVISCPCAMGLATPAALAVGLGRAAHHGILYTQPGSMELFRTISQIVFDKTGTLTTGNFRVAAFQATGVSEEEFRKIVYSLERTSSHPIAKSINEAWKQTDTVKWKKTEEIKGMGVRGTDIEGTVYLLGSHKISDLITDKSHHLYLSKNGGLIGWIDIEDEIRPEAKAIVAFCQKQGLKTILLSGDSAAKCKPVVQLLGIDEMFTEQSPQQKLQHIERLCSIAPTIMVGDGINDAPALAKATISISLSAASQLAIQSASVVLTNNGLTKLPTAMMLGKATYNTVKSNLFWAFAYNIVAIPVAALGYLHPAMGALIMGGSDGVLALNSLWLGIKKLK
ncbi:MAG: cation-translocating P-type ATPase [Chitinophagaceae bacterium]